MKARLQRTETVAQRGRPALPEGEAMVPVTIKMQPAQREKLQRLGSRPGVGGIGAWVRKKIDLARE